MREVFVAGHQGMVGSAIVRKLKKIDGVNVLTRERRELDLTNQQAVFDFFQSVEIDQVYFAAAKVGGIYANSTYPADFIYENLMMECNVIHQAYLAGIKKLLFLGSSCIYPKLARQPMVESELLSGYLEPTNEPYAVAKISGIKLCESYNRQYEVDYRSVMPTNLYGIKDNFNLEEGHVVPAIMRRFYEAILNGKDKVVVWGTGSPVRDFLYVDDMAGACIHLMDLDKVTYMQNVSPMLSHVNVGSGIGCSIMELSEIMKDVTGFDGRILFDTKKPDGTPQKLIDISLLNRLGWRPSISLRDGLSMTYRWFKENVEVLCSV